MTTNAVAAVDIVVKQQGVDRVAKQFNDLERKMKATNSGAGKFSKSMKGMGSAAKTAMAGLATAGTVAAGAAAAIAAVGVAAGAAVGAVTAFAVGQANANIELKRLADLSGLSIPEFQGLSHALTGTSISAEKFGDISKDLKDRFGEFATAGSGAFQDFVDVVGLTKDEAVTLAEEFGKLSGKDALEAVVSKLEDAGASGAQMTFVMESLAGDASLLLPLLSNNADELNRLSDAFTDANKNLYITPTASKSLDDLAGSYNILSSQVSNAATKIASVFAPKLQELIEWISAKVPIATKYITDLFNSFLPASDVNDLDVIADRMTELDKQIGLLDMRVGFARGEDKKILAEELDGLLLEKEKLLAKQKELNDDIIKEEKRLSDKNSQPNKKATGVTGEDQQAADEAAKKEAQRLADAETRRMEAIQRDLDMLRTGFLSEQELLQQQEDDKLAIIQQGIDNKLLTQQEANQLELEASTEHTLSLMALQERKQKEQAKIDEEIAKNKKTREDALIKLEGDSLDKLAALKDSGNKKAAALGKAAFVAQKALAIKDAIVNTSSGVSKALGAYPPPANFVMAGLVGAAGAAEIATISGIAHSGMTDVPNEGTYLLNKGERVLQPEQNKDLSEFLNNNKAINKATGSINVSNNIVIQQSDGESQASLAQRLGNELQGVMRATIQSELLEQQRSGNILNSGIPQAF